MLTYLFKTVIMIQNKKKRSIPMRRVANLWWWTIEYPKQKNKMLTFTMN